MDAAYADDVVIVGEGLQNARHTIDMQRKWATDNKMVINEKKSAIMFLNNIEDKKNKLFTEEEIGNIPVVQSYKYLGV